ncbi:hypothetical protein CIHG_10204 [Coccidioides immitis H538.4]|uniref:Uncharacterized protein n=2 Tax=Coccidioides immitis TaxID=5501 RepID=A0A0J8S800_COCIT|nr:hypothetical protein CIRG_05041 [Coccidioides immitis RMSCC 2394]KMU92514.1 hypothetical protein CIHG_10204 [Coccidioides immitis H538.4]
MLKFKYNNLDKNDLTTVLTVIITLYLTWHHQMYHTPDDLAIQPETPKPALLNKEFLHTNFDFQEIDEPLKVYKKAPMYSMDNFHILHLLLYNQLFQCGSILSYSAMLALP